MYNKYFRFTSGVTLTVSSILINSDFIRLRFLVTGWLLKGVSNGKYIHGTGENLGCCPAKAIFIGIREHC